MGRRHAHSTRIALAAALIALAVPTVTRADSGTADDDDEGALDDRAFDYTTPTPRAYGRGLLEVLAVLGVGFVQYQLDKSNTLDWDLSYDWESFRGKLLLQSISLDTNRFATNWATHPLAGYAYYSAMRQNRVAILPSAAVAFGASTLWEYVGEFKEQISINDLIVTPAAGTALGESTLQLGVLFQRSRPNPATRTLGVVFAPFKAAHDAIDGASVAPPDAWDDLGFPADTWHRIRLGVGVGATTQRDGMTQADLHLTASTRVVTLPRYGRPGRVARWFDSGEVSDLDLRLTLASSGVADFLVSARLMPVGYYGQDTSGGTRATGGHGVVVGALVGFEYGVHDYDRDRQRSADQLALVGGGLRVEHSVYLGDATFRAGMDGLVGFAGVGAYALPDYVARLGDRALAGVVAEQRYYHAHGGSFEPRLTLEGAHFDVGAAARFDLYTNIEDLDRLPTRIGTLDEADLSDRRVWARAWVGAKLFPRTRVSLTGRRIVRAGVAGPTTRSRDEHGVVLGLELDL